MGLWSFFRQNQTPPGSLVDPAAIISGGLEITGYDPDALQADPLFLGSGTSNALLQINPFATARPGPVVMPGVGQQLAPYTALSAELNVINLSASAWTDSPVLIANGQSISAPFAWTPPTFNQAAAALLGGFQGLGGGSAAGRQGTVSGRPITPLAPINRGGVPQPITRARGPDAVYLNSQNPAANRYVNRPYGEQGGGPINQVAYDRAQAELAAWYARGGTQMPAEPAPGGGSMASGPMFGSAPAPYGPFPAQTFNPVTGGGSDPRAYMSPVTGYGGNQFGTYTAYPSGTQQGLTFGRLRRTIDGGGFRTGPSPSPLPEDYPFGSVWSGSDWDAGGGDFSGENSQAAYGVYSSFGGGSLSGTGDVGGGH